MALDVAVQAKQAADLAQAAELQSLQASTKALRAQAALEEAQGGNWGLTAGVGDVTQPPPPDKQAADKQAAKKQAAKKQAAEAKVAEAQAAEAKNQAAAAQFQAAQAKAKWTQHDLASRKQGSVSFADLLANKQTTVVGVTLKIQ